MTIEREPTLQLTKMVWGAWLTQAIGTAARLRIADQLATGGKTAAELAASVGADAGALLRVMRLLVGAEVFGQTEDGRFVSTPLGDCLRSDAPESIRDLVIGETDHVHWLTCERLVDAVRTGRRQAQEAIGSTPWDYYRAHPEEGAAFRRAIYNMSAITHPQLLAAYDFSRFPTIVDIGGGTGELLGAILAAHSGPRGVLVDLAPVIADAPPVIERHGVTGRVELVGADFTRDPLPSGDLFILKHILHGWSDTLAERLLRTIRAKMTPTSRLLVIELVLDADVGRSQLAHYADLVMLTSHGGKERTHQEFQAMLGEVGLRVERVIPTKGMLQLLECTR